MSKLKGKTVQVTNPIEYGMALASFIIAGANVWPWHKGYKQLDKDETHHTYAWEDCGFLKMAGVFESIRGDYKSPLELIEAVREEINHTTKTQEEFISELITFIDNVSDQIHGDIEQGQLKELLSKYKQTKDE